MKTRKKPKPKKAETFLGLFFRSKLVAFFRGFWLFSLAFEPKKKAKTTKSCNIFSAFCGFGFFSWFSPFLCFLAFFAFGFFQSLWLFFLVFNVHWWSSLVFSRFEEHEKWRWFSGTSLYFIERETFLKISNFVLSLFPDLWHIFSRHEIFSFFMHFEKYPRSRKKVSQVWN